MKANKLQSPKQVKIRCGKFESFVIDVSIKARIHFAPATKKFKNKKAYDRKKLDKE